MNNKPFIRTAIIALTSLMAAAALVLGGLSAPAAALAAGPQDGGTPTPKGPFANGEALTFACKQEKLLLEGQQNRLDFANHVAAQTQTWIDYLKGKGKDTTGLETALAAYKTAISTAQGQHDSAQSAFNTQAGFDGNCNVTDKGQARTTLQTVRDGLRLAHQTISNGGIAFREALRDWRRSHRPNPAAGATATTAP
jgi:hypothetical protein